MESKAMNPYAAGALSGLLLIATVVVSGNYFGTSTAYVQLIAMLEKAVAPDLVAKLDYFRVVDPVWSWQVFFIIGIFMGSLAAASWFGDFKWQGIPDRWRSRFGSNKVMRMTVAFLGGIIAMIGARLAGGCPSGQMSAMVLLSVSGLMTMMMFFILGIAVAKLIYRGGGA